MNLFEQIRRANDTMKLSGRKFDEILTHRKVVARGFVFYVEHQERYYIIVNTDDIDIAVLGLPSVQVERARNMIYGIPVVEDGEKIKRVMTGVFYDPSSASILSRNPQAIQNST